MSPLRVFGFASSGHLRSVAVALTSLTLLAGACTRSSTTGVGAAQAKVSNAEQAVTDAKGAVKQANSTFCAQAKDYILVVDRYGKVFNDSSATVGDVKTLGADLAQPRASVSSAAQAVLDAHDALNTARQDLADAEAALAVTLASASGTPIATPSPTPPPATSSPEVQAATVDRVKQAEADLKTASASITDQTPLIQAAETFTSAAFALEVAWLNLFADAGCLTDQQSTQADYAIRDYTSALQQSLKAAGYFKGEVDGVYGPETVQAVEDLQTAAGLPVTGLVDRATAVALDQALTKKGESAAAQDAIEATAVQTTLKLAGYWPGPIDGKWTPELTTAVKAFQESLGVKQTGVFDAATLGAIEEHLHAPPITTAPPTSGPPPTAATPSG